MTTKENVQLTVRVCQSIAFKDTTAVYCNIKILDISPEEKKYNFREP